MQQTAPATTESDLQKQNTTPAPEMEDPAVVLAGRVAGARPRRTAFLLPRRLEQFTVFFQGCYDYFSGVTRAEVAASQTAEWLLDNLYVIEQAVRQIEEDLPADYYGRLPKNKDGWVRVYLVARANLRHEDTRLDIEQVKSFLQTFQEITPLSTGELWALPLMLRLAVLEFLAEALSAVTGLAWERDPPPPVINTPDSSEVAPDIVIGFHPQPAHARNPGLESLLRRHQHARADVAPRPRRSVPGDGL
jgi:hypothetical protein